MGGWSELCFGECELFKVVAILHGMLLCDSSGRHEQTSVQPRQGTEDRLKKKEKDSTQIQLCEPVILLGLPRGSQVIQRQLPH